MKNSDRDNYLEQLRRAFPLEAHRELSEDRYQVIADYLLRTGLDIMCGQAWWQVRKIRDERGQITGEKFSIETNQAGLLSIAEATGEYTGQDGPYWCGDDGVWKDVWIPNEPPVAAKVFIYRSVFPKPLWDVAKFCRYTTGRGQWKSFPEDMIAKCARSRALRFAFPKQLSGIYSSEEMEQAYSRSEEENKKPVELVKAPKTPKEEDTKIIEAFIEDLKEAYVSARANHQDNQDSDVVEKTEVVSFFKNITAMVDQKQRMPLYRRLIESAAYCPDVKIEALLCEIEKREMRQLQ